MTRIMYEKIQRVLTKAHFKDDTLQSSLFHAIFLNNIFLKKSKNSCLTDAVFEKKGEGLMERITLEQIFIHPIAQKYINRSGVAHAVAVAEYAFQFACDHGVDADLAAKAAFLHDVGHYTWYRNGEWDYELYRENDIHAIKGASRAHKLLIRIGEDRHAAKEIAVAILLHTDSYLPEGRLELKPLQYVVALADEADEESGGYHHYRKMNDTEVIERLRELDCQIERMESSRKIV